MSVLPAETLQTRRELCLSLLHPLRHDAEGCLRQLIASWQLSRGRMLSRAMLQGWAMRLDRAVHRSSVSLCNGTGRGRRISLQTVSVSKTVDRVTTGLRLAQSRAGLPL